MKFMFHKIVGNLFKKETLISAEARMNFLFIDEYNKNREKKKTTAICHAPSTNMYFSQNGEVKVCCHNTEFVAGKYPEQTIKEIWNSQNVTLMRQDMANYKLGKGCEVCTADLSKKHFKEVRAKHFDHIPSHPAFPTQMEFLLTNTCNLECVMCKGEFSSSIRKNIEKLPPIPNVYDDKFIEELEEFIPYLHETRFSGSGEAFLIDANYKIWEKIIELNPSCKIMVQTNGTVLNNRVKDILSRGNFHIGVSLDSLKKEVFEEIRPNSKFERVLENIYFFNEYCQKNKRRFNISTCVMRQNWEEMPDFINFSNKLNAVQTFHKVWFPRKYALFNLSSAELEKIHLHLSSFDFISKTFLEKLNREHYKYFQDSVNEWFREAVDMERKKNEFTNFEIDEIKAIVFQRIKVYFSENRDNLDGNLELNYNTIKERINQLIELLTQDDQKRKVLVEMSRTDVKIVIDAIEKNNTNQLLIMLTSIL
jgi:MoaA/NifB/PqqE/SkfB family radical SAM enzyme